MQCLNSWINGSQIGFCALFSPVWPNQGLFLIGGRFGHQQGKRCQSNVVDHRLVVAVHQAAVSRQKVHKQKSTTALVAIGKRVIFDDEIHQVCRLGLHGRVGRLTKHRLVQIAQQGIQTVTPIAGKQVGGFAALHQINFELHQRCTRLGSRGQSAA